MEIIQIQLSDKYILILTKEGRLFVRKLGHLDELWQEIEKPVAGVNIRRPEDKLNKTR